MGSHKFGVFEPRMGSVALNSVRLSVLTFIYLRLPGLLMWSPGGQTPTQEQSLFFPRARQFSPDIADIADNSMFTGVFGVFHP
jgi:hypothetical protein